MAAQAPSSPNEPKSAGNTKVVVKPEVADSHADVSTALPLTYANTKNSDAYSDAKMKLKEGDFEGALAAVETALKKTISLLPDSDELHESLAPLYYMYGTTLLYSIEESTDSAEASVMVQQGQQEQEDGGGDAPSSDNAEDLQIAWENLDTARTIVSRVTTSSHFAKSASTDPADAEGRDLVLDAAQIHSRLGDLQCANGNYGPALTDFHKALDIRAKALGLYDRTVADVYYRLGTTCVALAAEGGKARQQAAVKGDGDGEQGAASGEESSAPKMTTAQIAEYREQSIAHFLSCGRCMGGIVGKMCGKDPDEIAAVQSSGNGDDDGDDSDDSDDEGASPGKGKGKGKGKTKANANATTNSSPQSDDEAKSTASASSAVYATSSAALAAIRKRVANLEPAKELDADTVADLRELLDEIQEAIDTAREDLRGLSDVSEMKAKAEADVEAADRAELQKGVEASTADVDGGITTVGFGAPSMSSSAPTEVAAAAAPMMVVKKKKKKRDDKGQGKEDSKRAKM